MKTRLPYPCLPLHLLRSRRFALAGAVLLAASTGCQSSSSPPLDMASPAGPDLLPPVYHRPPPRAEPAYGFDAPSGTAILFGGDDGVTVATTLVPHYHDDTWVYDSAAAAWSASSATGPSARGRPAFAMDATHRRLLLTGGRFRAQSAGTRASIGYTLLDDTWAYDVAAAAWTALSPTGSPPARAGAVAVYDAARDRLVMFGGNRGTAFPVLEAFQPLSDTWQLAGGTQWSKVATKGKAPPARYLAAAALDSKRNRMVVVGGCCDNLGGFFSDAWALDLGSDTWTQLGFSGDGPSNRLGASAAYDPGSDRVVVFGGHDDTSLGNVNDAWALDGSGGWTPLRPGDMAANTTLGCAGNKTEQPYDFVTIEPMSPERRERALLLALGSSGLLLAGGEGDCAQLDDTWLLAAGAWRKLIPAQHGESCMHHGDPCACLCQ